MKKKIEKKIQSKFILGNYKQIFICSSKMGIYLYVILIVKLRKTKRNKERINKNEISNFYDKKQFFILSVR